MKLKDLIQSTPWPNISSLFSEIHPDAEEDIDGYRSVFEKLLTMEPEVLDMSIVVSKEEDPSDGEIHIDVSGLYNNPKSEEEHYSQAIEFTPWRHWLGMEISQESLNEFSEEEILVHCLFEMTYVGFSEEDIQKTMGEIEKRREANKSVPAEDRFVSEADIDELLNNLNED